MNNKNTNSRLWTAKSGGKKTKLNSKEKHVNRTGQGTKRKKERKLRRKIM
jgi:hypothetical protein